MPSVDYSEDAQAAFEDIRDAGKALTISRESGGTENPATGAVAGSQTFTGEIHAVELPKLAGIGSQAFLNQYAEDMVKGKIRFLLAAAQGAPFEPEVNDEIVMDAVKWDVLFCSPLRLADISILYKMGVRRK